jgi:hypothetical protein
VTLAKGHFGGILGHFSSALGDFFVKHLVTLFPSVLRVAQKSSTPQMEQVRMNFLQMDGRTPCNQGDQMSL